MIKNVLINQKNSKTKNWKHHWKKMQSSEEAITKRLHTMKMTQIPNHLTKANTKRKKTWVYLEEPCTSTAKRNIHWSYVVHFCCYCWTLSTTINRVELRIESTTQSKIILLQGNAWPHVSKQEKEYIEKT